MTLTWYVDVDWDGDEVYEADEASRMVDFFSDRGRDFFIGANGDGLQQVGVGRCTCTLDNYDGRYNTFNTSSPIYPDAEPGKYARVRVNDGTTTYNVLTGQIADIRPKGGRDDLVDMVIEDGKRWILDRDATTTLGQDVVTDTAIGRVLDAVDWPSIWGRNIGGAADSIPYWYASGRSGATEIKELVESELGYFWVAANGEASFKSRQTLESVSTSVDQSQILADVSTPQPWDYVRNVIEVIIRPRVIPTTGADLWTLDDPVFVRYGDIITVWADFTYQGGSVAAINVLSPVANTDFTANTSSDGSGIDITADISITTTVFATTTKIEIENTGSADGYMTLLKVRGDPVEVQNETKIIMEGSGAATKPRKLTINLPWLQNANTAVDFGGWLANVFGDPQQFPVVQVINRPTLQFGLDIFDVANIYIAKRNIDDDFRLAKIEHKWIDAGGQGVQTVWRFEPYTNTANFWRFTTEIGITSIFGF